MNRLLIGSKWIQPVKFHQILAIHVVFIYLFIYFSEQFPQLACSQEEKVWEN